VRKKTTQQNIRMNSAIQTSPEERAYPIRTFQVFGGIQTSLGILSGVLSFAGIVLDGVDINKYCYNYVADSNYYYKRCTTYDDASFMLAVDIPCLVSSGWVSNTSIIVYIENCWKFKLIYINRMASEKRHKYMYIIFALI
jgi:hypothetical protein